MIRGSGREEVTGEGDEDRARKGKMRRRRGERVKSGGKEKRRSWHAGKECTCLLGFLYKDKSPLAPMFS